MNVEKFRRLLKQYQEGTLSEETKMLLDKWFEQLGTKQDDAPPEWSEYEEQRLKTKVMSNIKPGGERRSFQNEFDRLIKLYQEGKLQGKQKAFVKYWLESFDKNTSDVSGTHEQALKDKIMAQLKSLDDAAGADPNTIQTPQESTFNEAIARYFADQRNDEWTPGNLSNNPYPIGNNKSQPPESGNIGETSQLITENEKVIRVRPFYARTTFRIAASILLILTSSYIVWRINDEKSVDVAALEQTSTVGKMQKIFLPDGTIVWLKDSSTLIYPQKFTGPLRAVALRGEALFEVAKDPAHPFVIQCGELTATALGTSFNIRSSNDNTEIIVLTGKVQLVSVHDPNTTVLAPNEKGIYNEWQKRITKKTISKAEAMAVTDNTEYNMEFDGETMREVVVRMQAKFNVTFILNDSSINNCPIVGNFSDKPLRDFLDAIIPLKKWHYTIKGDTVTLQGKGCQRKKRV